MFEIYEGDWEMSESALIAAAATAEMGQWGKRNLSADAPQLKLGESERARASELTTKS